MEIKILNTYKPQEYKLAKLKVWKIMLFMFHPIYLFSLVQFLITKDYLLAILLLTCVTLFIFFISLKTKTNLVINSEASFINFYDDYFEGNGGRILYTSIKKIKVNQTTIYIFSKYHCHYFSRSDLDRNIEAQLFVLLGKYKKFKAAPFVENKTEISFTPQEKLETTTLEIPFSYEDYLVTKTYALNKKPQQIKPLKNYILFIVFSLVFGVMAYLFHDFYLLFIFLMYYIDFCMLIVFVQERKKRKVLKNLKSVCIHLNNKYIDLTYYFEFEKIRVVTEIKNFKINETKEYFIKSDYFDYICNHLPISKDLLKDEEILFFRSLDICTYFDI